MKKISNPFNSKNSSDNFGIFLLIMSYQFALIGLNGIPIISSSLKDYFEVKNSLIMIAVFGVPAASVILLAVPIGSLSKKLKPFESFVTSLFCLGLSGLIGALSTNIYQYYISRILFGVAYISLDIFFVILVDIYSNGAVRKGRVFGVTNGTITLGNVVFTALGGALGELNWKILHLILSGAMIFAFFAYKKLPRPKIFYEDKSYENIPNKSHNKKEESLESTNVFSSTIFFYLLLNITIFAIILYSLVVFTPIMTENKEDGQFLAGMLISSLWLGAMITATSHRIIFSSVKPYSMIIAGFLIFHTSALFTLLTPNLNSNMAFMFTKYIMIGFGVGIVLPNCVLALKETGVIQSTGLVSSVNTMSIAIGNLIALPVAKNILTSKEKIAFLNESPYIASFILYSLVAVLAIIYLLFRITDKKEAVEKF